MLRRLAGERGSASIEALFVLLALLILVFKAELGVADTLYARERATLAAREAARVYAAAACIRYGCSGWENSAAHDAARRVAYEILGEPDGSARASFEAYTAGEEVRVRVGYRTPIGWRAYGIAVFRAQR